MNFIYLILEIVVYFGILLFLNKYFKKEGVYVWIAIAGVLSNIQVCKLVDILGIEATLGNVLFASTFLATDILNECYGKEYAKKGVIIGALSIVITIIITQITLLYIPNENDIYNTSLKIIFDFNLRTSFISLLMYSLSNYIDVVLYSKLRLKIWQKNNICTIICNSLENFGFVFLAFYNVLTIKELLVTALSTCIIEIFVALCDTPFLYLAKKGKKNV